MQVYASNIYFLLLYFMLASAAPGAPERGTYDVSGKLTALICGDTKFRVQTQFSVVLDGNIEVSMQPDADGSILTREGLQRLWSGNIDFPDDGHANISTLWTENGLGVLQESTLTAGSDLNVQSVDCVIDVPRAEFAGGRLEHSGIALPVTKPNDSTFFRDTVDQLVFRNADASRTLSLKFDHPYPVTVTDRWDAAGRSYRVKLALRTETWKRGESIRLTLDLQASAAVTAVPPASFAVNLNAPRYMFEGYGGDYCWSEQPAMTTFMLEHLRHTWTRHELKADVWDRERASPGQELRDDSEMMRRMQILGIPWIISVWHLPQRFYTDPEAKPRGSMGRKIASERWEDLLDLLGSYLIYLKQNYGAEPDLLSFNEPDLGIDVKFTPEEHRDAIKRIGEKIARLGLKTKLLLGDTANAQDTHRFVLATAADQEAMHYVGALSFHSWNGATPAQYEAWADVAEWLRLPLVVAEVGVDPAAYKNHTFDSYDYGLSEAAQQQSMLRYARPSALLFWQFTTDYGLLRLGPDGHPEPTARFWLIKHFADLTPQHSQSFACMSDCSDVLISVFGRDRSLTVHLLNLGPAREVIIHGLPEGDWRMVTTTETQFFQESTVHLDKSGRLAAPARGLVTLVR